MEIPEIRRLVLIGFASIFLFFGTFGVWATLSPLEGASIATGIVSIDSQRKSVQHLEGGIIAKISITEGEQVKKGQALITLDNTQAYAELEQLISRQHNAIARETRLVAERDLAEKMTFDEVLMAQKDDPRVKELLTNQQRIFEARRDYSASQKEIINKQLAQNKADLEGQKKRLWIEKSRLSNIRKELESNKALAEKGFVSQTHIFRLEREENEIRSSISQLRSNVNRISQHVAENKAQMKEQKLELIKDVVEGLRESRQERYELEERISAAKDVLNRTVISAPLAGTILNLKVFSEDGVISPGQTLLDIVPIDERMLVEARVDPSDIDQITQGMKAQIRLTALNMRSIKPINGEILTISADRIIDEQTGDSYYLARVAFTDDMQKALNGIKLYPGMQAEVLLLTGSRTPLEYLTKPLTESLNRAFREE